MGSSVRFRPTPAQRVVYVLPLAIGCLPVVALQTALFGERGLLVSGVAAAIAVGGAAALVRWWGIELTADAIVVRRNTARAYPWSEVEGVRSQRRGTARCVLLEIGGRRLRCPAPVQGLLLVDRDFEDKLAYIEQWWRWCRTRDGASVDDHPLRSDVGWGQRVVSPGRLAR